MVLVRWKLIFFRVVIYTHTRMYVYGTHHYILAKVFRDFGIFMREMVTKSREMRRKCVRGHAIMRVAQLFRGKERANARIFHKIPRIVKHPFVHLSSIYSPFILFYFTFRCVLDLFLSLQCNIYTVLEHHTG